MAKTTFSEIYDNFSLLQRDYRLTNLYNTSITDYEAYLSGWLIDAIQEFSLYCDQSLAYTGTMSLSFDVELTQKNILALARLMKKFWLEKEVNDVLQFRLKLQDHDYKTFAEANNLQSKQKLYVETKEELSQMLVDYGYQKNDWASWLTGTFYTP
jgi:hypothetical protein